MDSRRLTGPNLVWDQPGALLEVAFRLDEDDPAHESEALNDTLTKWLREVRRLREAVGLPDMGTAIKLRRRGAWLVVGGPIDQLYALTELNELAWSRATGAALDNVVSEDTIREHLQKEAHPRLIALEHEADLHGVTFLWDDDFVSLGMGRGSKTWPMAHLPDPALLNWDEFSDIPVAVVTGTNGKSTNVRLLGYIASCAGWSYGTTSTDWIRVGDEVIDTGDYSGPGGARTLLRDPRIDIAFLETARGGLLRRGTGVRSADVALITNVAEDHMGQYGIHSVQDLVEAKMVVARLVQDHGVLVLNADDPELCAYSVLLKETLLPGIELCWFSLDAENPVVTSHIQLGGTAFFVEKGTMVRVQAGIKTSIAIVESIPLTLGGLASYNMLNCLSATAVALEMGIPLSSVQQGLTSFESTPESNPGRSNYFKVGGFTVLLDYAHNVHGLSAILETTAKLGATRRVLTLSTAGDRTDHEIRALARAAAESGVDEILVTECVGYERELGKGGVPRILLDELSRHGISSPSFESELEGAKAAISKSKDGDLLILLVKAERAETLEIIRETTDRLAQ